MMHSKDALRSFFGTSGKRGQTVFTPEWLLDAVRYDLGGRIGLDPCTTLDNPCKANVWYTEQDDGLTLDWSQPTFCNPPYNRLKAWMYKALQTKERAILLVPVRPNRSWWMEAFESCDACVALKPIKFVGFEQCFPAPLCLMYFGCKPMRALTLERYSGRLK